MVEQRPIDKVANDKAKPRVETEHERHHYVDPTEEAMTRNPNLSPPILWGVGRLPARAISHAH